MKSLITKSTQIGHVTKLKSQTLKASKIPVVLNFHLIA
jgi:hypothetical protein